MSRIQRSALLMALVVAATGIGASGAAVATTAPGALAALAASAPTVVSVSPADKATNVPTSVNSSNNIVTGTAVLLTFSEPMAAGTIASSTSGSLSFTLIETAGKNVRGTVSLNAAGTVATFIPKASALDTNTRYTATISTAATDAGGTALAAPVSWSFTTSPTIFTSQAPVQLGTAGTFAILSQTGVTNVYASAINGNVGASPITGAAILLTCPEVMTGTIYSVDAAGPACKVTDASLLTTAVGDMGIAYSDAAGRAFPDAIDLGAGEIGGLTLRAGLYKWNTDVAISTSVSLSGGPDDVFIFQIAGNIDQASATRVNLIGGVQAKNVFWQAAGAVSIGTTAHFEGAILSKTMVAMKTGASINGRLLAQTAVTLQSNTVTQPAN